MEVTYDGEFLRRRTKSGYRMESVDEDEMLLICAAYTAYVRREREKQATNTNEEKNNG